MSTDVFWEINQQLHDQSMTIIGLKKKLLCISINNAYMQHTNLHQWQTCCRCGCTLFGCGKIYIAVRCWSGHMVTVKFLHQPADSPSLQPWAHVGKTSPSDIVKSIIRFLSRHWTVWIQLGNWLAWWTITGLQFRLWLWCWDILLDLLAWPRFVCIHFFTIYRFVEPWWVSCWPFGGCSWGLAGHSSCSVDHVVRSGICCCTWGRICC